METSIISRLITPLAIAFIMFGMGMSLTLADFKRVWVYPKVILTGIFLQIICLPLLGFCFVSIFNLEPILATSIMLLSACPGGAITNLVSFISKGDAALSVSLTAVNSLITVVTIPILVTVSITFFLGEKMAAKVDALELSLGIILVTIPPIILGMMAKKKAPEFAEKSESAVKKGTIVFLVVLAAVAIYSEKQLFMEHYRSFTLMAAGLCILSFFMGALVSFMLGLPRRIILTLAIEAGLHNSAMGIVIAISFLGINALAIFAAFYLVTEYVLSGVLMVTMNSPMGIKILGDEG